MQNLAIRQAGRDDSRLLWAMVAKLGAAKSTDYFDRNFEEQEESRRQVFIAEYEGTPAGYCILNWQPKYGLYRNLEIPETQDLNVLPAFRRRGIATAMIAFCEDLARKKGKSMMGISVGLDSSYGPAQILYVKLGYIPDGQGITYDRKTVLFGDIKSVDDNLCLMMVKSL